MGILVAALRTAASDRADPCVRLVEAIAGSASQEQGLVSIVVVPAEWDGAWPALREAIEARRPQTVLLFDLHLTAERLRVELVARNHRELGVADAVGAYPSGPGVLDGPERIHARLAPAEVAAALREAGLSFEWSRDAGGRIGNDTFYRLAFNAADLDVREFGLFRMPLTDETVDSALINRDLPEVFCSISEAKLAFSVSLLVDRLGREAR